MQMNPNYPLDRNYPKELNNIPLGQVFVLTNPEQGITNDTISAIRFVYRIAKPINPDQVVNTMSVSIPELWGCYVCKLMVEQTPQLLIADNKSLLEMLSVLWGVDYSHICQLYDSKPFPKYKQLERGGQLVRIKIRPTTQGNQTANGSVNSFPLQALTRSTKDELLGKIRSIFQDNFNQGIGLTLVDVLALYEEERNREQKTWHLDVQIEKGKEDYNKNYEWVQKMNCKISLVDPEGNKHPLKLGAQEMVLYLTFILFKDGIKLVDLGRTDFYTIYKSICERIPSINNIPDEKTLVKNAGGKRNKIKNAIKDIIKEPNYLIDQFAIEGYEGEEYKVSAATDDHRDLIRKAFDLE